jgi:hypothetical protein
MVDILFNHFYWVIITLRDEYHIYISAIIATLNSVIFAIVLSHF